MKINKLYQKVLIGVSSLIIVAIVLWKLATPKEFFYIGTIEATEVDLSSRISSIIAEVPVKEGDKVEQDRTVVRLAAEDLKITAEVAQLDFQRAERLFKVGSMPKETQEHLKFKRDETALKLSWASVKSPISGRVITRYREPGEWASPGMKLLTLANLEEVWVVFYVEQPILSKISLGMPIRGYIPEMKDRIFEGKVVRISDEAEFTPKNVQTRKERTRLVFGIKVEFPNPGEVLKPGMSIESKILE